MTVRAILSRKGRDVATIAPTVNLSEAVRLLAQRRIGAVVVTGPDSRVAGILSERDIVRSLSERGPAALDDPERPYNPRQDIEVVAAAYRPGPRRSLHWTITIRNRSRVVAYRDPLYFTTYVDERETVVDQRHERLKDIFEPGVTRTIELNDGYAGPAFAKARFEIMAAEALLPVPPG